MGFQPLLFSQFLLHLYCELRYPVTSLSSIRRGFVRLRTLTSIGIYFYSSLASASAFQLWEQDAASIGNYHAGYAAAAEDASTAFYNPAGLTRFKEQQLVVSADNIFTSFKYRGTVRVNTIGGGLVP